MQTTLHLLTLVSLALHALFGCSLHCVKMTCCDLTHDCCRSNPEAESDSKSSDDHQGHLEDHEHLEDQGHHKDSEESFSGQVFSHEYDAIGEDSHDPISDECNCCFSSCSLNRATLTETNSSFDKFELALATVPLRCDELDARSTWREPNENRVRVRALSRSMLQSFQI